MIITTIWNQQYINNVLAEEKRPGLCSAGCRVAASPLQSSLQRRTPVHCVIPEEEEKGGGEGMRRRKDEEEGGGGRRRRKEEEQDHYSTMVKGKGETH
jgi:hypothetical protein